jgi:DNA sulfur modification protein DndE
MGVGDKDLPKLKTSMEKIQKYQMVTNMKEVKPPELLRATNV